MRVEETSIGEQDKELLTKEMKKKLGRRRSLKLGGCGNCLIIFLFIFLTIFLGSAWAIAETGLVDVPFFSRFYKEVEPAHLVNPTAGFSFENKISRVFSETLISEESASPEGSVPLEISLTEEELTYLIRQIENGDQNNIKFSGSQIAIDSSLAEFYTVISFPKKNLSSTIKMDFVPRIVNGELKLELQKIKLGNLSLPSVLGNLVVKNLLSDKLSNIGQEGLPLGKIIDINLGVGEIIIKSEVKFKI